MARAPAARPARVADHSRDPAARRRPPQRGRPSPPRAGDVRGAGPAATEEGDDTLFLLFSCCHPELAPASQVALTLRAVGGLTTREIADAFYVPEALMAQRISRAKRALRGRRLDQPGDLAVVLRVLYLVYTAGHAGRVDLAGEAIRLARQLTLATEEPEARGLLALTAQPRPLPGATGLRGSHRHARPTGPRAVGLWNRREIAEGVRVLQSALAMQTEERRPSRYQVEAAIAALHDDAASAVKTDWPQILAWYDDLVALTDDPVHQDPAAVLPIRRCRDAAEFVVCVTRNRQRAHGQITPHVPRVLAHSVDSRPARLRNRSLWPLAGRRETNACHREKRSLVIGRDRPGHRRVGSRFARTGRIWASSCTGLAQSHPKLQFSIQDR